MILALTAPRGIAPAVARLTSRRCLRDGPVAPTGPIAAVASSRPAADRKRRVTDALLVLVPPSQPESRYFVPGRGVPPPGPASGIRWLSTAVPPRPPLNS